MLSLKMSKSYRKRVMFYNVIRYLIFICVQCKRSLLTAVDFI